MSGKRVGVLVLVLAVVLGCGVFGSVQADEVKSGKSEAELDAGIAQQMSFIEKGLKTLESGGEHYYYTVADMEAMSLERAQAGDHVQQSNLGFCYYYHREENTEYIDKALYWLEKAAAGDNADALLLLGMIYHEGTGVDLDNKKAAKYFARAMENGNKLAQSHLGVMYYYGIGVEKDYAKTLKLLEPLAAEGMSEAQLTLGLMYYLGQGVERNYVKAVELWQDNMDDAEPMIQCMYGALYLDDLNGIDKDYYKALNWIKKSAQANHPGGLSLLGFMYFYGKGVEKNYHLAKDMLMKAIGYGDEAGCYELGIMYENGIEVKKDLGIALKYYNRAAKVGIIAAREKVSELTLNNGLKDN